MRIGLRRRQVLKPRGRRIRQNASRKSELLCLPILRSSLPSINKSSSPLIILLETLLSPQLHLRQLNILIPCAWIILALPHLLHLLLESRRNLQLALCILSIFGHFRFDEYVILRISIMLNGRGLILWFIRLVHYLPGF